MKKNIKIEIAVGIILTISVLIGGSIWLANKTPQTAWQHLSSLAGIKKPDANAPSQSVFLGDSITAQEDWNVLFGISSIYNTGISGDTTDDLRVRLISAVESKPKKLFLMIGINDLIQGKDPAYVLANYAMILESAKSTSPKTTVYIQSVLPINNDILEYGHVESVKIIALNEGLKELAAKNNLFFIDLYPSFCGSDNKLYAKYTSDGLHPNSHGYAIWKNLIVQYVK